MRGRTGRMASGGGSESVGAGSTAISGGSSDICRNLTGGRFRSRHGLGPVKEKAAPETIERADHGRTQHGDQHEVARSAEGVVGKRGREVEAAKAAQQSGGSSSRHPPQGRGPGGDEERPLPEGEQNAA